MITYWTHKVITQIIFKPKLIILLNEQFYKTQKETKLKFFWVHKTATMWFLKQNSASKTLNLIQIKSTVVSLWVCWSYNIIDQDAEKPNY